MPDVATVVKDDRSLIRARLEAFLRHNRTGGRFYDVPFDTAGKPAPTAVARAADSHGAGSECSPCVLRARRFRRSPWWTLPVGTLSPSGTMSERLESSPARCTSSLTRSALGLRGVGGIHPRAECWLRGKPGSQQHCSPRPSDEGQSHLKGV